MAIEDIKQDIASKIEALKAANTGVAWQKLINEIVDQLETIAQYGIDNHKESNVKEVVVEQMGLLLYAVTQQLYQPNLSQDDFNTATDQLLYINYQYTERAFDSDTHLHTLMLKHRRDNYPTSYAASKPETESGPARREYASGSQYKVIIRIEEAYKVARNIGFESSYFDLTNEKGQDKRLQTINRKLATVNYNGLFLAFLGGVVSCITAGSAALVPLLALGSAIGMLFLGAVGLGAALFGVGPPQGR